MITKNIVAILCVLAMFCSSSYCDVSNPFPANNADCQSQTPVLNWSGEESGYNIYFGDDFNAVDTATEPFTVPGMGHTSVCYYEFKKPLALNKVYYWRVDSINQTGQVTKGPIWSFRTGFYDSVTCSSYSQSFAVNTEFFKPANIIDGDWISAWRASSAANQWIKINFTRAVSVGAVVFVESANETGNIASIRLQFSDGSYINYHFPVSPSYPGRNQSGIIYTPLDSVADNSTRGAHFIRFVPRQSTFVNVQITSLINDAKPASIAELRVIEIQTNDTAPTIQSSEYDRLINDYELISAQPASDWNLSNADTQLRVSSQTGWLKKLTSSIPSPVDLINSEIFENILYFANLDRQTTTPFNKLKGYKLSEEIIDGNNCTVLKCLIATQDENTAAALIEYQISDDFLRMKIKFHFLVNDWCRYRVGFYAKAPIAQWPTHRDCGWWKSIYDTWDYVKTYSHAYDICWEQGNWNMASLPLDVIERSDRYLMYGSFDLDSQLLLASNVIAPQTYPALFVMPFSPMRNQTFGFDVFFKTFDRSSYGYIEAMRWYMQRTSFEPLENENIDVRLKHKISRTIPQGRIVAGHVPAISKSYYTDSPEKLALYEQRMLDTGMKNIWYGEWDLWVHSLLPQNEPFRLSSTWAGYRRDVFTGSQMRSEISSLKQNGFHPYAYMNQFVQPSWCPSPAQGGRLIDIDNTQERQWYIDRAKSFVNVLKPDGIAWDVGWSAMHYVFPNNQLSSDPRGSQDKGWLKTQALMYQWLKTAYPHCKVIINHEGGGLPTKLFTDAVIVEGGGLGSTALTNDAKIMLNALGGYRNPESIIDPYFSYLGISFADTIPNGLDPWPGLTDAIWLDFINCHLRGIACGCTVGGSPDSLVPHDSSRRLLQPEYMGKAYCLPKSVLIQDLGQFSAIANSIPLVAASNILTTNNSLAYGSVWSSKGKLLAAIYSDMQGTNRISSVISRQVLSNYDSQIFDYLVNVDIKIIGVDGLTVAGGFKSFTLNSENFVINTDLAQGQVALVSVNLKGDYDDNGSVDFVDLQELISSWLMSNPDIDSTGALIGFEHFAQLSANWQAGK